MLEQMGGDQQLLKEDAKALAMRQRFNDRAVKFMDSKQRTIGVDKQYLDKQLEENRTKQEHEKQQGIKEAFYLEQMIRYHDEQVKMKETERKHNILEIYNTLEEQKLQPKNNALSNGGPLNVDECGPSSIQWFEGEDTDFHDRKKTQEKQFREWCKTNIELKAKSRTQEKEIQKKLTKQIIEEDRIQRMSAIQEQAEYCRQNKLLMLENKHLASIKKKLQHDIISKEKEIEDEEIRNMMSSPLICEETISKHNFRPDHFKGFSPEKIKAIIQTNSILIQEKENSKESGFKEDKLWDQMQSAMLCQMEEAEQIKFIADEEQKKAIALTIHNQRKELKEKQLQMERDKFGEIGYGFFQKFGTSCR